MYVEMPCYFLLWLGLISWFLVPYNYFSGLNFFQNSNVTMASNPPTNFDLTSGTFVQGLPIDRLVTTHSPNKGQTLANLFLFLEEKGIFAKKVNQCHLL